MVPGSLRSKTRLPASWKVIKIFYQQCYIQSVNIIIHSLLQDTAFIANVYTHFSAWYLQLLPQWVNWKIAISVIFHYSKQGPHYWWSSTCMFSVYTTRVAVIGDWSHYIKLSYLWFSMKQMEFHCSCTEVSSLWFKFIIIAFLDFKFKPKFTSKSRFFICMNPPRPDLGT